MKTSMYKTENHRTLQVVFALNFAQNIDLYSLVSKVCLLSQRKDYVSVYGFSLAHSIILT